MASVLGFMRAKMPTNHVLRKNGLGAPDTLCAWPAPRALWKRTGFTTPDRDCRYGSDDYPERCSMNLARDRA
jgi:hypothetical protein